MASSPTPSTRGLSVCGGGAVRSVVSSGRGGLLLLEDGHIQDQLRSPEPGAKQWRFDGASNSTVVMWLRHGLRRVGCSDGWFGHGHCESTSASDYGRLAATRFHFEEDLECTREVSLARQRGEMIAIDELDLPRSCVAALITNGRPWP